VETEYDRLQQYISKLGYTFHSLENKLGIAQSSLSQGRKRQRSLSPKILLKLKENFPNLDINWLKTGLRSKVTSAVVSEPQPTYGQNKSCDLSNTLDILNNQLLQKDAQIENLTKIIINLTSKLS